MSEVFQRLDRKKANDIRILSQFVSVFCREKHQAEEKQPFSIKDEQVRAILGGRNPVLCQDCRRLLSHGIVKLLLCPYDPKPMCKKCPTHCYAPGYREKVREVMRFSGIYLLKRGRLDLMFHYLS
ncbi:MAG: nitrous oxide-stimulated promoter family protein [Chloroflexi bacterium]|nr:nitrous oxide-stimulated promoter family protein [Chloroflexota bacterium]